MAQRLTPVASTTRREAVLTELRDAILSGTLAPGERLKEVQLAADLGVSRPTLREAIYQLIHEGLLVQETYKGVSVAGIDASTVSDVAVTRLALESLAARTVATDKDGQGRDRVRAAWEAYDEAMEDGDLARANAAHLELHRTIWAGSGNVMLQRIWPIVSSAVHVALMTDSAVRHDDERSRREHRELVEAILSRRTRAVDAAVKAHIEANAAALVEVLRDREERDRA